jgi:hypothetical protein
MYQRIIVIIAFWVAGCSISRAEHVRVFLLAGQSNINGATQGSVFPSEWNHVQDDVWIWLDDRRGGGNWTSLGPGHGGYVHAPGQNLPLGLNPPNIGPELSAGRLLADAFPNDRIALIKHAEGGRDVKTHWNPQNIGPPNNPDHMWSGLLQKTSNAFRNLQDAGHSFQVEAVFWAQGERDARNLRYSDTADPAEIEVGRLEALEQSSQYQQNLTRVIEGFRLEFGSDLPFIMARMRESDPINAPMFPGLSIIRAQQAATAATMSGVYLFDTDDLPRIDRTHFSATGQIEHGRRFTQAYLSSLVAPTAGDYNANGKVDAADYVTWRNSLGSMSSLAADADRNGTVGQEDYSIWKANFGKTLVGTVAAVHHVPEPSTLVLFGVCICIFFCGRNS